MLGFCVEALKNINAIVGKSNQSAASDLGVAAVSLSAAVRGAWLNVLINIGGIKDTEFVQDKKDQGTALVAEAEKLAENIYKNIVEEL
jgi:formiminotetrahydrofolate cyclodeaminase